MTATTQLEWRRRWKPDLAAQVWQPIQIKEQGMLVKCLFRDDCYEILVYDMVTMWWEDCSQKAFKRKAKSLNPNVEAPVATLLHHLNDSLEKQSKKSSRNTYKMLYAEPPDQSKTTLQLSSQLTGGVPFRWEFDFEKATHDMYTQHLATPLLMMVSELCRRQSELHRLLTRKDAEIEDYKAAGGKVSRKHLETTPFDEKAFHTEMTLSKAFERQVLSQGMCTFDGPGQELYKQVMMTNAWLNRPEEQANSDEEQPEDMLGEVGQTVDETGPSWANRLPPSLVANAQTAGASVGSPTKSITPRGSPVKSTVVSPGSSGKDAELMRRQALERRLADEKAKRDLPVKKKKKKIF